MLMLRVSMRTPACETQALVPAVKAFGVGGEHEGRESCYLNCTTFSRKGHEETKSIRKEIFSFRCTLCRTLGNKGAQVAR